MISLLIFVLTAWTALPQIVQKGTGTIKGQVVGADTGQPIPGVHVIATGRESLHESIADTDQQGRYVLDLLPPDDYRLRAERPEGLTEYLSTHYGGDPDALGRTIRLNANATATADVALPRAASMTGRLLDDEGRPVTGATVMLTSDRLDNQGQPRTIISRRTRADGIYRVDSLAPGTYRIQAVAPVRRDEQGRGLASTWFRATRESDLAEPVTIVAGQQLENIDIQFAREPILKLQGTVFGADGRPAAGGRVRIAWRVLTAIRFNNFPIGADGSFTIPNLFAGKYEIVAGAGEPISQIATRTVELPNDDGPIELHLRRGGVIHGRLVVPDAGQLASFTVESIAPDRMGTVLTPARHARVKADGTFLLDAQFGPRLLRVRDLPPTWCLEAVTLGTRDITNVPTTFLADARNDVEIVVGHRRPVITGRVQLDDGQDAVVVVLPDDPAQWVRDSTALASAWPDSEGHFEIAGLPAGDYRAIATDKPPRGFAERQRDALEWLWRNGSPVTIHAGQVATLTLHITRLP